MTSRFLSNGAQLANRQASEQPGFGAGIHWIVAKLPHTYAPIYDGSTTFADRGGLLIATDEYYTWEWGNSTTPRSEYITCTIVKQLEMPKSAYSFDTIEIQQLMAGNGDVQMQLYDGDTLVCETARTVAMMPESMKLPTTDYTFEPQSLLQLKITMRANWVGKCYVGHLKVQWLARRAIT